MSYWPSNYDYLERMRMNPKASDTPRTDAAVQAIRTDTVLGHEVYTDISVLERVCRQLERDLTKLLDEQRAAKARAS